MLLLVLEEKIDSMGEAREETVQSSVRNGKQHFLDKQIKEMLTNVILMAVKSQLELFLTELSFENAIFPM